MGKVSKKIETPKIVEAQIIETTSVDIHKEKGRPINLTSKRQIELAKKAEAKANGTFKKGRPKNKTVDSVIVDSDISLIFEQVNKGGA